MGNRVRFGALLALLLALAMPLLPAQAQLATDGWSGTVEACGNGFATQNFGSGPASPPHGSGSLQFSVAAVDDGKVWSQFVQRGVVDTPLTAISELRYWTFVSRGTGHAPHLFLDVDLNGDGVADDRLIYQPELNGTVTPLTWQEWSAAGGRWWSQRGLGGLLQAAPGLLTSYALAFPNARLAAPEGGQGGLGIGVGCLGSGWGGWQGAVDALVFRAGTLSFFWDFEATGVVTTRGGGVREGPTFRDLRPVPWSTVAPGSVTITATATTPSGLRSVRLSLDGRELPVTESGDRNTRTVSAQLTLQPGFFVVTAIATDELGRSFTVQWQFVVSPDPRDSWWFRADGTPRQQQITASLRALSEAFRWHFFGYSWDGAYHPEMPSHAAPAATIRAISLSPAPYAVVSPATPVRVAARFVSTDSALDWPNIRLLVAGRQLEGTAWSIDSDRDVTVFNNWEFPPGVWPVMATAVDRQGRSLTVVWGFVVSNDANENPWFYPDGRMKAEAVTRTLRTLVEGWRWHTRGQSWDGEPHPEFPTHATGVSGAEPLPQWFDAQGRPNQQAISDTLRMLEREFRWHFWGISWDGDRHPEIPTHAD